MSNSERPRGQLVVMKRKAAFKSIPAQLFPPKVPFKGLVKTIVRKCSHAHCWYIHIRTASASRHHPDVSTPSLAESAVPSLIKSDRSSFSSAMSDYLESEGSQDAPSVAVASESFGYGASDVAEPESVFTRPPAEPDVPDPFLIDDEDDSGGEEEHGNTSESQHVLAQVSLAAPSSPNPLGTPLQSPNRNKDVPPPPPSDSDEEEAPELYLPGLCIPTMFLPIPNTDPLTTLVNKYIHPPASRPVRDLNGEWQRTDFHTLVMSNSWRALARMARDRIVTSDPEDLPLILGFWYLRLSSLARMRLFNQTTAECTNLFSLLNAIEPPATREWLFERVLPFELEVMYARLKYWTGDHMAYLDALYALLKKCKTRSRRVKGEPTSVAMWKERGSRICLIIASQLVEMKDFAAATRLLEPLCRQGPDVPVPALRSAIARVHLQSGNLGMAAKYIAEVAEDPTAPPAMKMMNAALLAAAEGDWPHVTQLLRSGILDEDAENYVAVNNLCVALLSQGKLKEGIEVMENALKTSPESVVVAEPFLFNLSTLYELRASTAIDSKRGLLLEVAKWSGDGLKTACLKMPLN